MPDNIEKDTDDVQSRGLWSSRFMFILAAAGSAIGLGNIWKFPYVAGKYGGGAFVLVYLGCILLIGVPILIAEISIGRASRKNPVGAFKRLGKGNRLWLAVGFLGVASGFVILSYYSVVAGWTLAYFTKSVAGSYMHADLGDIQGQFGQLLGDPWQIVIWHTVFMAATIAIVIFGVKEGLERWIGILMPVLFVILVVLVIYGLAAGDAAGGLGYLFKPDWSKLITNSAGERTARPILEALGHAFFTLSLGMGAMITYGSYLGDEENVAKSAVMVAGLDTLIALMAAVAIFTILFKFNLDPEAAQAGLVFQVLPLAFSQMPGGRFLGMAFFLLLGFAALTSGISLLEVVVAHFIDDRKWKRKIATLVMGGIIWFLGLFSALSFNVLKDFSVPLMRDKEGQGMLVFDAVDLLATNYMLPIGGLFIAVFAGWFLDAKVIRRQMMEGGGSEVILKAWRFVVRFISPVAVFILIVVIMNDDLGTSTGSKVCDAARSGNFEKVKALVEKDQARLAERSDNGWAPLHYSARYGHLGVAALLLSEGAAPNIAEEDAGLTPLHLAADNGKDKLVLQLLEFGADPRAREKEEKGGRTPLHMAAASGNVDSIEALIEAGADVNARDAKGLAPLHYAASRGYLAAVKVLVEEGADVNARTDGGLTPRGLPAMAAHQLVDEFLESAGGIE